MSAAVFGVRGEFYPEDFLIPFVAMRTGGWCADQIDRDRREPLSRPIIRAGRLRPSYRVHTRRCDPALRGHVYGTWAPISAQRRRRSRQAAQILPGPHTGSATLSITVEALITSKTPVRYHRRPAVRVEFLPRALPRHGGARTLCLDLDGFPPPQSDHEADLPFATGKLVPLQGETDFDTVDYHATLRARASPRSLGGEESLQAAWSTGSITASPRKTRRLERDRARERRVGDRAAMDPSLSMSGGSSVSAGAGRHLWRRSRPHLAAAARPPPRDPHSAWLDHLPARGFWQPRLHPPPPTKNPPFARVRWWSASRP